MFYSARQLRAITGLPIFGTVSVAHPVALQRQDLLFGGVTTGLLLVYLLLVLGKNGVGIG